MFLQSCFIRNNTPRLRERLHTLGYNVKEISLRSKCITTAPNVSKAVGISEDMFDDNNPHRTWNCNGRVDCGTNEELFLALAALRNDTDRYQWFTDIPGHWYKNNYFDEGYKFIFHHPILSDFNSHKATVKEIIEHFKEK